MMEMHVIGLLQTLQIPFAYTSTSIFAFFLAFSCFPCFLAVSFLSLACLLLVVFACFLCFLVLAFACFPFCLACAFLVCLYFFCLAISFFQCFLILVFSFFSCFLAFLLSLSLLVLPSFSFFPFPRFLFLCFLASFSLLSLSLRSAFFFFLLLNTIVQSTVPAPGRSGLPNLPSVFDDFLKQSTCYSETRLCKARCPHPGEVVYLTYLIFLWFLMIVLSILRFRCFLRSCLFPYQCWDGPFPFSSSRAAFASPSAVWLNSLQMCRTSHFTPLSVSSCPNALHVLQCSFSVCVLHAQALRWAMCFATTYESTSKTTEGSPDLTALYTLYTR